MLAVSVVAQATFLGAVFQGLLVLGPVLRSAYGLRARPGEARAEKS
jgi:hypothetical protein